MMTPEKITVGQLERALAVRHQIESLQLELAKILGGELPLGTTRVGKRKMSASARAKIGAAQKARWAKLNGKSQAEKPKRRMSAKARAAISAAAKERWKKAKAAGKTTL